MAYFLRRLSLDLVAIARATKGDVTPAAEKVCEILFLSIFRARGRPVCMFPIPRGAVVLLNKTSALLWVHGVTPNAMNPNWKYYQGKR